MTDRGTDRPDAGGRDPEGHGDVTRQRLVRDGRVVGFEPHGERPPIEEPEERPVRRLTIDALDSQVMDPTNRDPSPSDGPPADDDRRHLPDAEPG